MTFTPGRDSPPYKYTAWGGQVDSQPGVPSLGGSPHTASPLPPFANPGVSELPYRRAACPSYYVHAHL